MTQRNCVFTIFSKKEDTPLLTIADIIEDNKTFYWTIYKKDVIGLQVDPRIKYICYQREMTTITSRHHYQGYVEFTKPLRRKAIQQLLNPENPVCYVAERKGTQQEAIAYVKKSKTRVNYPRFVPKELKISQEEYERKREFYSSYWSLEHGSPSRQGQRTDVEKAKLSVVRSIGSKTLISDFAKENPEIYVRYHQGIEKLVSHLRSERKTETLVEVYWGDSGTGKTKKCYDDAVKNNQTVYKKPNGQWWDGYDGQDVVLLDDYDGYINFREFLQLTDRYPHKVQVKGSFKEFTSKLIIITSNINPLQWYPYLNEASKRAFQRRINKCYRFEFDNSKPKYTEGSVKIILDKEFYEDQKEKQDPHPDSVFAQVMESVLKETEIENVLPRPLLVRQDNLKY